MREDVSLFRLYLLRALYLGDFILLGLSVWPGIVTHRGWANPLEGVGVAVWGALSLLALIGVRYPLKMLPLLFLQFSYKIIWVLAVAVPRIHTGAPTWYMKPMLVGAIVEPLLMPWGYIWRAYIRQPGDRWRNRASQPAPEAWDGSEYAGGVIANGGSVGLAAAAAATITPDVHACSILFEDQPRPRHRARAAGRVSRADHAVPDDRAA